MTRHVDAGKVDHWVRAYMKAWESNHPEDVGALFAPNAVYRTGPFDRPIVGRDAVVADWLDRRDEPGTWRFEYTILAVTDDLAVVRGTTFYSDPAAEHANLWLIRLDPTDRCRDFAEWWIERPRRER
jgi:hypothetical protein